MNNQYRPLITSLAFNDQNIFLPFKYNFTIQQIESIKKYLPKNLFKFIGVDVNNQNISKEEQQLLQKAKLKIKAKNGISIETKKQIKFHRKNEVKLLQWYNKCINLKIPFYSKESQQKTLSKINDYVNFYLQNFMFFKNSLTQQIIQNNNIQSKTLTCNQIAHQTDIIFTQHTFQPQTSANTFKQISVKLPIILCIVLQQKYLLKQLKQLIKNDLLYTISILLKNNFNTKVVIQGQDQKQFVCLNSYCMEENRQNEEKKLREIIGQKKKPEPTKEEIQKQSNNQKKFLLPFLIVLVMIYVVLKLMPIQQRDKNLYLNNNQKAEPAHNSFINETGEQKQQIY